MQGSTYGVVIRNSLRGFEFLGLNSLLLYAFSGLDKKIKIIGIVNGSVEFENYLKTLNTEL